MAYERVNWENLPSKNTPVNATNLNKLNDVIDAKANSNDVYTKTETDTKLNKKVNTSDLIDLIYPVGSIYMSVNSTNPAILFGGTWEQIKDRFLLACGSTYKAGDIGGESTHELTINELPKNSMKIPHITYYDNCSISGGGWKQIGREQTEKEGAVNSNTNDGWHIMSIGNNEAHNNMPPYLVVNIWQRTA